MQPAYDDWYHHTEFTCWSGIPGPDDEPSLPVLIPPPEPEPGASPSSRGEPAPQFKLPEFTPDQNLRLGIRLCTLHSILADFRSQQIETMAISVDATRVNILARFPGNDPLHPIGLAKRHATLCTRRDFQLPTLRIWSQHALLRPIASLENLADTRNHIVAQAFHYAAVWSAPAAFEETAAGCVPELGIVDGSKLEWINGLEAGSKDAST